MSSRLSLLGLLLALLAAPAAAQVTVTDAWVRGTVPGQKGTGAFMQLTSAVDVTLVSIASPAARVAEIHEMVRDGNMMRMRAVDKLVLPAGKPIDLEPGGYHVMLMDLTQPLREGETIPIMLTFADKEGRKITQEIKAPVRALTAATPRTKH
jgi:periplasmic copper chaperone A